MAEMLKETLETKINRIYQTIEIFDNIPNNLHDRIHIAESNSRFDSKNECKQYVSEGTILNINKIVSGAIGIPSGSYVVYETNPRTTMLVPTESITANAEIFEKVKQYEIYTDRLLNQWNKLERSIAEAKDEEDEEETAADEDKPDPTDSPNTRKQQSKSKYPRRSEVRSAVIDMPGTQAEIAAELGVDPSTVSRWTIKHTSGAEPGGRTPTLRHAVKLAKLSGQSVDDLFPDEADKQRRKKTDGSGGGRNKTYRKGNKK